MGIVNIHLLHEDDASRQNQEAQRALETQLAKEHNQGSHRSGEMAPYCPLCPVKK